MTNFIITMK